VGKAKVDGISSFGINPYESPRLDEQEDQTLNSEALKLDDGVYGFWLTVNAPEDVTDPKSKAEALAYREADKPFKFLSKDEKKVIEASVVASAVLSRKQFPVLVDFPGECVYAASGNVEEVGMVRSVIEDLGARGFCLAWQYEAPDWPQRYLGAVNDKNKFEQEMTDRAEELTRFRPEEVEKLDDKSLESIVSSYFAMSELETGTWCGLKTPARIRLFKPGEPVSASNPSTAFSVLHKFDHAEVAAASVVFQALDSKFNRKGEEKQYRTDLFTIDVNDNVNLTDAGAAMLRGFDIPTFKREMKKAAKGRAGGLAIKEYWTEWLSAMKAAVLTFADNVTETLKIDKKKYGLRPYEGEIDDEVEGSSDEVQPQGTGVAAGHEAGQEAGG
jgi:hypothetical protein